MRKTVAVSPAVAKALEAVGMSADDFLRQALNIKAEGFTTSEGVSFPEGAAFLAWYKDRPHFQATPHALAVHALCGHWQGR